jgi:UDP-GlcNAc:undecaprenyl-phosphate GlcNAc-1-phosphate transferase
MSPELSAAVGFSAAGATSLGGTPLAIAIAGRTDFYDRPRGYRKHAGATPLLGGAAVLVGFLAAAIAVGATSGRLLVPIGCALSLWLIGTIDDRVTIAPIWRLLAETIAAVAVVVVGLGWKTSGGGAIDLVLSVIWVVGLVNAFNLMDNLDGACSAVGCVSAVGIGILAAIHGQAVLAGLAFGLAGGVPAVEPGGPREGLPRRRRKHADRLSRRRAGDDDWAPPTGRGRGLARRGATRWGADSRHRARESLAKTTRCHARDGWT